MKNLSLILGLLILLLTPRLKAQTAYHDYLLKRDSLTEVGFTKELYEKAKQGDASSQFILGHHYDEGYYVEGLDPFEPLSPNNTETILEQDDEKAFEWFLKAAEQGLVFAQYEAAEMLSDPLFDIYTDDYTPDEAKLLAEEFYIKASQQNCPLSMYRLGGEQLIKSAEMGNPDAKFALARIYANGLLNYDSGTYEIEPDLQKALTLLKEIADAEYYDEIEKGDAWEILADNYFYGKDAKKQGVTLYLEIEQDYEKAFYYYEKIVVFQKYIDSVDPDYFYKLGLCYLNGYGIKPSKRKARSLIKEAAEYNHPEAVKLWDNRKNW